MGTALTSKDRRHSGWITPRSTLIMNRTEMINECLEPQDFWDDWKDYRDGFRINKDRKQLRNPHMGWADYFDVKRWNARLKRLISRRKMRKIKKSLHKSFQASSSSGLSQSLRV